MSDLPNIRNGWNKEEMAYGDEAISHFQRKVIPKSLIFDEVILVLNFFLLKMLVYSYVGKT